jgi:hypothetical protein
VTAVDLAATLRRQGYLVITPRSPAGKSGVLDGSPRTSRAANATSTAGDLVVTGARGSKVARSVSPKALNLERFTAFAAAPDVVAEERVTPIGRRAPLTRTEFTRQAEAGSPASPKAAANRAIKLAWEAGLIPKAVAAKKLPPVTDPGARAVALARQAGVIR